MATCNGETYLQEQLDSLCNQSYLPCELVVGDDRSTDATIAILEAFSRRAPFPVRIVRNTAKLGYGENFLHTASKCSGDWIAFCDQDDIWLPHKLERCANAIRRDASLVLVLQNATLVDESLNRRGDLFPNAIAPGTYQTNTQYGFWVWLGFLQTVRSSIIGEFDFHDRPPNYFPLQAVQSHDKWTCMLANALGGICVQGESVALYRRHEHSLTGAYTRKALSHRIDQAISTGARHYRFLSDVAARSSSALRRLGRTTVHADWSDRLNKGADKFDQVSQVQARRAQLYESVDLLGRLWRFSTLWLVGGYVGSKFAAMGWRSAVKDAAVTLFGERGLVWVNEFRSE